MCAVEPHDRSSSGGARTWVASFSFRLVAKLARAFLLSCLATLAYFGPRLFRGVLAGAGARRGARLGTLHPCRAARAVTRGLAVIAQGGPEEPDELACDGDDDLVGVLSARHESLEASGQASLGLVGDRQDALGLPRLAVA